MAKTDFPVADQPSAMVDECLQDAQALRAEKEALSAKINANREILRNLRTAGKANAAQLEAITAFYKDRDPKTDGAPADKAPAAKGK